MRTFPLLALFASLTAAGAHAQALTLDQAASAAAGISAAAQDQGLGHALAALYERLHALEDARRGAVLEHKQLAQRIAWFVRDYQERFRERASLEEIKALCLDPNDRDYPPLGSSQRKALEELRPSVETELFKGLEIEAIDLDIAKVEARIDKLLERIQAGT